MNSIKKTCINSSKHFYTGNELSPLRFGLSAEGYELNSVMEGYDKELWVVDIKNSKKFGSRMILLLELREKTLLLIVSNLCYLKNCATKVTISLTNILLL